MSRNHKFHNAESIYFVSFAVVEWLDVFTRSEYKDILLENLAYCQKQKGMEIYAWCIMSNHRNIERCSCNKVEPHERTRAVAGGIQRTASRT